MKFIKKSPVTLELEKIEKEEKRLEQRAVSYTHLDVYKRQAIALVVNYPDQKVQRKVISSLAPDMINVVMMVLGAGVLMGILNGPEDAGMSNAIAQFLVSVIPESLGRYFAVIIEMCIRDSLHDHVDHIISLAEMVMEGKGHPVPDAAFYQSLMDVFHHFAPARIAERADGGSRFFIFMIVIGLSLIHIFPLTAAPCFYILPAEARIRHGSEAFRQFMQLCFYPVHQRSAVSGL